MRALAVLLALGACTTDETLSGFAGVGSKWVLEADAGLGDAVSLELPQAGQIAGKGPCNRYSATQTAPYPWFEVGPIVSTRLACPNLDAETAYFAALSAMTLAEVSGDVLILSNGAGAELVFMRAAP